MKIFSKLVSFLSLFAVCISMAHAQAYPNKPIKLIVPFPPGGTADILGRMLGEKLATVTSQSVIIENRAGAAGGIAAQSVAKSPADGYTLLFGTTGTQTMNPAINSKLPYDSLKDFASVSNFAASPFVLVINPNIPAQNLKELIDLANKKPGALRYASFGTGSSAHMTGEMFKLRAGVDITHVPYKGATQAAVGAAAGEVDATLQGISTIVPLVQGNKARLIAVCTPQRMAQFPDVPTVSESGIPGFKMNSWFGLMAPAGTPKEIIAFLNREVTKALADPNVKERLIALGLFPVGSSADEMSSLVKSQLEHYRKVITQAGIKAD